MLWIVLGLMVYILFGFLLFRWAAGDFTLTASYPGEILLVLVLWPFCLRGFVGLYFLRLKMQRQKDNLEAWAKSKEQDGSDS